MSEQKIPDTDDVTIDGYCDCYRYDMGEVVVLCGGGCGDEIRLHRAMSDYVHLDGKHWHLTCVFESVVRQRQAVKMIVKDVEIRNGTLGVENLGVTTPVAQSLRPESHDDALGRTES